MPRRLILSATERDTLLALPESQDDLIRYYTFNDSDLSLIRQRRWRRQPSGLCGATLPAALPRLCVGHRQRAARAGDPVGGQASPDRSGELGEVRRARRDPSRARPGTAHLPATGPVRPVRLPRPGARADRTGPADRQGLAAGRSGAGEPAAEATHPAGVERDRPGLLGGHCAGQSAGLPRPGRSTYGLASGQAGRAVDAQGRQQHHLVDLAATGTAETQLPAHA
ncbi:transposase [Pseudomonas putida TRO1]|uniref:Transposase n=1 Tax=Pseudomonas putida TRO1 TaxID=1227924 RepID=A0AAD2WFI8_PSEPU|nr:transposase [Pseudomonas putida TRO1]